MTGALDQVGRRAVAAPTQVGQATAIEQARAVAEVAAAVQVARQFPRDMQRVLEDVEDACGDYELAKEAFYAVKNRGDGPSVHLARELARIFGNFQYGVHELRRDDEAGESEVQAFAWDVERNTRSSRTFIVPHAKMKDGKRVQIVDLDDIYRGNQNTGARAVREVIFSSLPKRVVRYAEDLLRATLEAGNGETLAVRRQRAVDEFGRGNVTRPMLEKRVGKPFEQWNAQDVASLVVLFESLRRGETTREEAFGEAAGQPSVSAAEITAQAAPKADPPGPTQARMAKLHALLHDRGVESDEAVHNALAAILRQPVPSRKALTADDVERAITHLEALGQPPTPPEPEEEGGDR